MLAPFHSEHWSDAAGRPAGGVSYGTGFSVSWQHGPLGRGEERREPNGAFVETIIAVAKDRLEYYQRSQFAGAVNAIAIAHLVAALAVLDHRTNRRDAAGTEGTHAGA